MLSVGNVIFVLIEIVHYWARLSKCFCCCWSTASQDCVTLFHSLSSHQDFISLLGEKRKRGIFLFPLCAVPFSGSPPILHQPSRTGYYPWKNISFRIICLFFSFQSGSGGISQGGEGTIGAVWWRTHSVWSEVLWALGLAGILRFRSHKWVGEQMKRLFFLSCLTD